MENLRILMKCLDDISKVIPEGTYLEMCDNLKKIHDNLHVHEDPPVIDLRRAPFQPVPPIRLDHHYEFGAYDQYIDNENTLRDLEAELRHAQMMVSKLKTRRNITRTVKESAIREKAAIERVELTACTYTELCNKIPLLAFTSERDFYNGYLEHDNRRITDSRRDYSETVDDLEVRISDFEDRQDFLYNTYNL